MAAPSGKSGKRRVTFTIEAPGAREVYLCGTFNDWAPEKTPMKPAGNGAWKAQVMLVPGTYEYRLRVDGDWADDPAAERRVPNAFGTANCVREVVPAA
jgi:1,4-alpha-glucan branching enzyme